MKKTEQLTNRLREVILNGAWIANTNYKDQLENLDWKIATTKFQSLNTISILAQHIHYYIGGIMNVFINGKLEIRDKYSFDFPTIKLNQHFVDEKYGTYQRNIDGMLEHSYYHLGQIVLIKKMILENQ